MPTHYHTVNSSLLHDPELHKKALSYPEKVLKVAYRYQCICWYFTSKNITSPTIENREDVKQGLVFTYVSIVVPFVCFHVCFTCVRSCVYVVYHLSYPPPQFCVCYLVCIHRTTKWTPNNQCPFASPQVSFSRIWCDYYVVMRIKRKWPQWERARGALYTSAQLWRRDRNEVKAALTPRSWEEEKGRVGACAEGEWTCEGRTNTVSYKSCFAPKSTVWLRRTSWRRAPEITIIRCCLTCT